MIVFDLVCRSGGHVFEAWFGSSEDYDNQRGLGLVQCPLCGTGEVEKAVMAPRLNAKANQQSSEGGVVSSAAITDPEKVKEMLTAMATAQKKLLENSEYVGRHFAMETRAIHIGEAEKRSIHGQATVEETQSLVEDGIHVTPLPFPVIEPGEEN